MATDFQKSVWTAMTKIPEGRVTTYGAIAGYLKTKAVQAVGTAVGKNPNAPVIPCHRVVPFDGRIGNYSGSGGVGKKIELLAAENVSVENGKIVDFNELFFDYK